MASFYTDPVTADCGHKFCRACTLQSWGTLQQIPQRNIRPNRFVSNIVKSIERLSKCRRTERPCHMAVLMLQNEILQRCQTSGI
uniref:Zinc finger C3HC4 RING-type domain-containing protein n=1 Tax=Callorhinchus milii TaxID=7868 RepID=A0A4W3H079_CALMI